MAKTAKEILEEARALSTSIRDQAQAQIDEANAALEELDAPPPPAPAPTIEPVDLEPLPGDINDDPMVLQPSTVVVTDDEDNSFFERIESKWIPEAEDWFKLHSVQAMLVIIAGCASVVFFKFAISAGELAVYVIIGCVLAIFLRFLKQGNLHTAVEQTEDWIKSKFNIVSKDAQDIFDRLKKLEDWKNVIDPNSNKTADDHALTDEPPESTVLKAFGKPVTAFKPDPTVDPAGGKPIHHPRTHKG